MEKCRVVYPAQIQDVAKALSGDLRLKILQEVSLSQRSMAQLAESLGVAQPTISINIQILEAAGLVQIMPGTGREKIIVRAYDTLLFHLPNQDVLPADDTVEVEMPIGLYSACRVSSPCGLTTASGYIGTMDDPNAFYLPERVNAALIYFGGEGFLEYHLPNPADRDETLSGIVLSAELCSEAPGYQQVFPSDITLSLNGCTIGTWKSPGDFGDRRGKRTPEWWPMGHTQYGSLTTWEINTSGCYVNGSKVSDVVIRDVPFAPGQPISLRLSVNPDAPDRGGLNLFGEGFGDTPHHLRVRFTKTPSKG